MVPPAVLAGVVTAPFLAHQGGWDEFLMVAVPVGLFAFLLYSANKRAARLAEADAARSDADDGRPDSDPDGSRPGGGPGDAGATGKGSPAEGRGQAPPGPPAPAPRPRGPL